MNKNKIVEVMNEMEKIIKKYIKEINGIDCSKLSVQEAKFHELINEKMLFIAVMHEKLEEALNEE